MPPQPELAGTVTHADLGAASRDPRALRILAKTIYRELRQNGLVEQDVIAIAGELLGHVTGEVSDRRRCGDEENALSVKSAALRDISR